MLGCVDIVTFAVQDIEIDPLCIKMYLFEMQIDSMGGSSLLAKIDITVDNLHAVLRMFSAIESNSADFFKMKGTVDRYL